MSEEMSKAKLKKLARQKAKEEKVKSDARMSFVGKFGKWIGLGILFIAIPLTIFISMQKPEVPENVQDAVNAWNEKYNCIHDVQIEPFQPFDTGNSVRLDESGRGTLRYPVLDSGQVLINEELQYFTTLHAMTHACIGETTFLDQPIITPAGSQILGFSGASFVNIENGEEVYYRAFEEGLADYLASQIQVAPQAATRIYTEGRCLVEELWSETPEELASLMMQNDLPEIADRMFDTDDDLLTLLLIFMNIDNGNANCQTAIQFIDEQGWR